MSRNFNKGAPLPESPLEITTGKAPTTSSQPPSTDTTYVTSYYFLCGLLAKIRLTLLPYMVKFCHRYHLVDALNYHISPKLAISTGQPCFYALFLRSGSLRIEHCFKGRNIRGQKISQEGKFAKYWNNLS